MSSVKRRKIDGDVPPEILKKKVKKQEKPEKTKDALPEPVPVAASSDEAASTATLEQTEEAVTKSFKDLVSYLNSQNFLIAHYKRV